MRIFGERAETLRSVGADVTALAALEAGLAEGLPAGPGRLDAHVHLGRDADGHELDLDGLLADLDAAGIEGAVCFPANEPGDDGRFTAANDAVLAAARSAPGRVVPFCRVDPGCEAAVEIARAGDSGARGLKLHPVAQRFALEADACVASVARATERGWPVLIHAGYGARPLGAGLARLRAAVPEARLILAHGARGDLAAVLDAVAGDPGVWFDTSLAALPDLVQIGPGRLVFGSDRPYGDHATARQLVGLAARAGRWTADEVDAVLGDNLRGLLV